MRRKVGYKIVMKEGTALISTTEYAPVKYSVGKKTVPNRTCYCGPLTVFKDLKIAVNYLEQLEYFAWDSGWEDPTEYKLYKCLYSKSKEEEVYAHQKGKFYKNTMFELEKICNVLEGSIDLADDVELKELIEQDT